MALQVTGQAQGVVLATSQKSGAPSAISTGWHNEFLKSDLLPRHAYLSLSGLVFSAAETTFAALTAAGTTTTGLTVWNPTNSGKNLSLLWADIAFTPATLATVAIAPVLAGIAQAATPTFGSAVTPVNHLIGSGIASVAKAGTGSTTIAASPAALRVIGMWNSTVLSTNGGATSSPGLISVALDGGITVPPGNVVTFFGIGTVADATVASTLVWAELPI